MSFGETMRGEGDTRAPAELEMEERYKDSSIIRKDESEILNKLRETPMSVGELQDKLADRKEKARVRLEEIYGGWGDKGQTLIEKALGEIGFE